MHILIAEDDEDTAGCVSTGLAGLGHTPTVVFTGDDALRAGLTGDFDVIVLDRMLPGLNGVDALRRLRAAEVATPVLILTAMGSISDRVQGLEAGADDYLVKPFALEELAARLNALHRRPPLSAAQSLFEAAGITLDLPRREVTRRGRPVALQPREFSILELLIRNAGRVVTRTMLLQHVWGYPFDPQTNIVESHLSRLRSKLRDGFGDDPIETLRGFGYRLRDDA